MKNLRIYNGFGIKPTNTHVSAGMDFYVPNIDMQNENQYKIAFEAYKKSFNINDDELNDTIAVFKRSLMTNVFETQIANILHLYFALYSKIVEYNKRKSIEQGVITFINEYLVFDDKGTAGVKMQLNDTLCINSGIKVALEPGTAGIFFNKSGKGNAGFDIRACVVDEDYAGYVHLSVAYTKDTFDGNKNIVYCGDKLTQMVVLPVYHLEPLEINENDYNEIMKNSTRGADAFGSSDVKH